MAEIVEKSKAQAAEILLNVKRSLQYKALQAQHREEKVRAAKEERALALHQRWIEESAHTKIVKRLDLSSFVAKPE
jgi:hypothetical protein